MTMGNKAEVAMVVVYFYIYSPTTSLISSSHFPSCVGFIRLAATTIKRVGSGGGCGNEGDKVGSRGGGGDGGRDDHNAIEILFGSVGSFGKWLHEMLCQ